MNTHETYVSLETAKLLKELGFDWECPGVYVNGRFAEGTIRIGMTFDNCNWNGELPHCHEYNFTFSKSDSEGGNVLYLTSHDLVSAPSLAIVDKWLRETKNIHIEVMFSNTGHNYFLRYCDVTIHGFDDGHWHRIGSSGGYATYEEALEDGIESILKKIEKDGQ